ncbi:MAG: sigma-54 interaction domain-containing protein [Oleiphilus sp.]
MNQPRLFVSCLNAELEQSILMLETLSGYIITKCSRHVSWVEQLEACDPDIAIIEISGPEDLDAEYFKESGLLRHIEFIFLSDGKPNAELDKLILRGGGYHFRQPIDLKLVTETLSDFYEQLSISSISSQKALSSDLDQFGLLVGSSKPMRKLFRTIRRVANTTSNVLVIGESGVGKELVANTLHLSSDRVDKPFVAINCGALSPELVESELFGHIKGAFTGADRHHEGVFSQAEGGTLFLDEVTEMPLDQQVKLLRVLESNEFRPVGAKDIKKSNVRIVAASNRDPSEAIAEGFFREDLFFRLAQFPIQVPPLRDRGDDAIGLAKHFLAYRNDKESTNVRITMEAMDKIAKHSWPGNVRELKHSIERAFILADDVITAEHLIVDPLSIASDQEADSVEVPSGLSLEELERNAILQALEENSGNKSDTAAQLGISVKTLYNKLEKYQREVSD